MAKKAYIGVLDQVVRFDGDMHYDADGEYWVSDSIAYVEKKAGFGTAHVEFDGVLYKDLYVETYNSNTGNTFKTVYIPNTDIYIEFSSTGDCELYDSSLELDTGRTYSLKIYTGNLESVARKIKAGYVGVLDKTVVLDGSFRYDGSDWVPDGIPFVGASNLDDTAHVEFDGVLYKDIEVTSFKTAGVYYYYMYIPDIDLEVELTDEGDCCLYEETIPLDKGRTYPVKVFAGSLNTVARKIKKAYIGDSNGKAKLCWTGAVNPLEVGITYSGNMTDNVVTMSGKQYRLLTLTSSGTLNVSEAVDAEVWMCGGGTSGGHPYRHPLPGFRTEGYNGGGGAGAFTATGTVALNSGMVAVIGSGGGATSGSPFCTFGSATSFAGLTTSVAFSANPSNYGLISGISGGTGGGSGDTGSPGTGDGVSKYPFGDSAYFKCHCAGGGAGARNYQNSTKRIGGVGGTNGGDGGKVASTSSSAVPGGAGGDYGGGGGGTAAYSGVTSQSATKGSDASFYGSGGGGGAISYYRTDDDLYCRASVAGAGYQGVIYIRIPITA